MLSAYQFNWTDVPFACAGTESEVLLAPPFTLVPVVRFDVLPLIVYVTTKFAATSLPELFKVTATVLLLPLHEPCAAELLVQIHRYLVNQYHNQHHRYC